MQLTAPCGKVLIDEAVDKSMIGVPDSDELIKIRMCDLLGALGLGLAGWKLVIWETEQHSQFHSTTRKREVIL